MCVCVCTTHVYYSAHVEVRDNFVESGLSFYLYVGSEESNSVRQACVTSALITEHLSGPVIIPLDDHLP